jgi:hypothetical protein
MRNDMTQKNGTFQDFKEHTLVIARGERSRKPGDPKIWSEVAGSDNQADIEHRHPREGGNPGASDEAVAPGFPPSRG